MFDEIAPGSQDTLTRQASEDQLILGTQVAVELNIGSNDWKLHLQTGPADKVVDLSGAVSGTQIFHDIGYFQRYQGHIRADTTNGVGFLSREAFNTDWFDHPAEWNEDVSLTVQFRVGAASADNLSALITVIWIPVEDYQPGL